MIKSIIGKSLSNELYDIKFVERNELDIHFIDFKYNNIIDEDENNKTGFIDIFTQKIKLKEKRIEVNEDVIKSVNDTMFSEFVNIVKKQGLINRENSGDIGDKFDIDFKKWKTDLEKTGHVDINKLLYRKMFTKIINCSNYIAVNGRIGLAHFVITNEKTHRLLFNRLDDIRELRFYVSNELEDSDMIIGRKNDSTQPGILLFVNESDADIAKRVFSEQDPYGEEDWENNDVKDIRLTTIGEKKYINLPYEFISTGFFPEKQFFYIKIINND